MNINQVNRVGAVNPYRKQVETGKAGSAGKQALKRDGVEFSDEARKLASGSGGTDPARTERIAELKEAVATGTYSVEAGKVAEKLLPRLLAEGNTPS